MGWKSVTELGYDLLRDLNGKFVKAERTPTGRTYTNKTTGKEVNETTLKFVKVYESEAACIRRFREDAAGVATRQAMRRDDAATTVAKALIATANGDLKKLAINLKAARSPYTVDSEFIVKLLKEIAGGMNPDCLGDLSTMRTGRLRADLASIGTAGRVHRGYRR